MSEQVATIWKCQPQAEALIQQILDGVIAANSDVAELQADLLKHTSSRLFDWVDHVNVSSSDVQEVALIEAGFSLESTAPAYRVFHHAGAQLPRIVVWNSESSASGIAVSVDSIADFLMVRGLERPIEGAAYGEYRRCLISTKDQASLWVIERRGTLSVEPSSTSTDYAEKYTNALEKWLSRPRGFEDEERALDAAFARAREIAQTLGVDMAACVVLEGERRYWQARNTAAQLQKNRQDRLGMGWANHDHHTFRSSRKHFHRLVCLFEALGFHCRERFYAGAEAGWGAQVMENPRARLVLFLDVDLAPHEVEIDFAHHTLPELPQLGTIGLWCSLHGDSILRAGMHHLEAQFLFEELTQDLHKLGVGMMQPFSNYPYLKQAFTHGEVWMVKPERVHQLLHHGKITKEQAEKFISLGAVGSHLENLQRREGYKGFNQKNVSYIIKETDPRRL